MSDTIRRHPLISGGAALFLLILLFASVVIVPETSQGVVVQVGRPVRMLNAAGPSLKVPFFENIIWVDKRVRGLDMDRQQVLSTDQRRLEVDAFARYRVVDPLRLYLAARSVERAEESLKPILDSQLRNELGKRPDRKSTRLNSSHSQI